MWRPLRLRTVIIVDPMSDQLSLTQKWLHQNIQAYKRKDLVYSHVDTVLATFSTLRPKTDVYTFDDGRSQLLLCVHGLLPITYRRASYNIPIAAWLTLEYPAEPPLVYVVPTGDMLIKVGKFVDVSGRCEPPYIHTWRRKNEGCNIKALMETLTDHFCQEPPVYAKPKSTSPPPQAQGASSAARPLDYASRPPPPAPGSPRTNGYETPSSNLGPTPPIPQRPTDPAEPPNRPPTQSPPPPVPHYSHIQDQDVFPRSAASRFVQNPPTYTSPPTRALTDSPPHPHLRNPSVTNFSSPPVQGQIHQYAYPESSPQRWSVPSSSGQTHPPSPSRPPPPPGVPNPSISIAGPSSTSPPPPPLKPAPPAHAVMLPVAPTPMRNYLEEDETPQTAVQPTNVPPRPPNPEVLRLHAQVHAKFASELAAFDQAVMTDMQRLRATQSDLLAGEPAIRDEMARLEAVRDVCRGVASRFRTTVESAESNLTDLRRKGDPEVDELICSTTIVYNQLVDLVAEDNAIEDTIYHLHRALNAGRIDLDKFLRTTRTLAEEQFMKRALAEKIVASIPLGAWR